MQCPICNKKAIDDNASVCPACKSDLQAFKQLNYLKKTLNYRKVYIVFFVIIIFSMAIFGYIKNDSINKEYQQKAKILTNKISEQQKQILLLESDKNKLIEKIVVLRKNDNYTSLPKKKKNIVKPLSTTKNKNTDIIFHTVKRGENLRSIALKYFKDKKFYTKIMKDNGIKNANHLRIGQKLKIYK